MHVRTERAARRGGRVPYSRTTRATVQAPFHWNVVRVVCEVRAFKNAAKALASAAPRGPVTVTGTPQPEQEVDAERAISPPGR